MWVHDWRRSGMATHDLGSAPEAQWCCPARLSAQLKWRGATLPRLHCIPLSATSVHDLLEKWNSYSLQRATIERPRPASLVLRCIASHVRREVCARRHAKDIRESRGLYSRPLFWRSRSFGVLPIMSAPRMGQGWRGCVAPFKAQAQVRHVYTAPGVVHRSTVVAMVSARS